MIWIYDHQQREAEVQQVTHAQQLKHKKGDYQGSQVNPININKFFSLGGGQNAGKVHQNRKAQRERSENRGSSLQMQPSFMNSNTVPLQSKHKHLVMRSTEKDK